MVWKRLEAADLAERVSKRKYRPVLGLAKHEIAPFRER